MEFLFIYVITIVVLWINFMLYTKCKHLKFKGWEPTLAESIWKYSVLCLDLSYLLYVTNCLEVIK
ncbi:MAG: hypothetical protein ACRC92_20415 [Peptostreptococcaceae bacterium]